MKWRGMGAGLGVLVLVLTACGPEEESPEEKAAGRLEKALTALSGQPHRADVEVDVYALNGMVPGFKLTAEMRGTHRSMPGNPATDLDLSSVTTEIELRPGPTRNDSGAVRVITIGDQTYVRNTLQSGQWRTLPAGPRLTGKDGYDPASTATMVDTIVIAEIYRGQIAAPRPSATTEAGEAMSVFSASCTVAQCLEDSPEARKAALSVYPGDAVFNSKLWVDGRDRPRRLTMTSEFFLNAGRRSMDVKFKATLTLHDLGKPQNITAPSG
ncbi:hypothetical protein E1287_18570 [Actinomadura sp. KC06]|uniref:hypothetical protein n=1 Tax=Actinomadura sp. KC06 TaxID=2530369 RepID=UPI001049FBE1|nr:hypothetical protein [Actinomadura sp. KC06]TDD33710.1 hypothetical protein E1287_18570 [Actinomadura sp. KC06]